MPAKPGTLVLIKIGDGGSPTEVFTTLGGLRTSRMSLNQDIFDASHVESGLWRLLFPTETILSMTISGGGIFTDSIAEETLRSVAFSGSARNYSFVFANGHTVTGTFKITQYERAGDHDAEEIYAITLESAGALVFSGA